ncbi:MAG TPA: DUF2135 domain-containing protein [Spirochaetia bacterium]|nr:DUF2135 domain-containing protein [Spirochaetia bacterium]
MRKKITLLISTIVIVNLFGINITIEDPHSGYSSERVVHIKGNISENAITQAFVNVNGLIMTTKVSSGNFDLPVVLAPGNNFIEVIAKYNSETAKNSINLFSKVPKKDLKVVLVWDTDNTDLDLWVTDPNEEACGYSHRETKISGNLDVDVTTGYGPETFTLGNAIPGSYKIHIHYYSSHGNEQSKANVYVIMFEGSSKERRQKFETILTKSGDRYEVGSFEIKPDWLNK